jgi:hypothetical protein
MGMVDAPTVILVTALATAGGLIGWLVQLSIATLFFLGILIGAYGGVLVAVGVGLWDTPEARAQVRTRSSGQSIRQTRSQLAIDYYLTSKVVDVTRVCWLLGLMIVLIALHVLTCTHRASCA